MCLLTCERQVAELIDDEQPRTHDRGTQVLPIALLALSSRKLQHQIRCRDEARLDAGLGCQVPNRDRQVRLTDSRRPEQYNVLVSLDEGKRGEALDLLLRG